MTTTKLHNKTPPTCCLLRLCQSYMYSIAGIKKLTEAQYRPCSVGKVTEISLIWLRETVKHSIKNGCLPTNIIEININI